MSTTARRVVSRTFSSWCALRSPRGCGSSTGRRRASQSPSTWAACARCPASRVPARAPAAAAPYPMAWRLDTGFVVIPDPPVTCTMSALSNHDATVSDHSRTRRHAERTAMRLTLRGLQAALGLVWLLDAILQFQPAMFTRSFPDQILRPAAQGNPAWVAGPVNWGATLVGQHVVLADAAFAIVQLVIALAILWPRTTRLGLALSVPWALAVWWLGEGLGGVLTGAPSAVAGAPGAVILYALLAVLLWPEPFRPHGGSVAAASPLGPLAARLAWVVLWASLAYDTLLAASRAGLAAQVAGQGAGEPGWLAAIDRAAG